MKPLGKLVEVDEHKMSIFIAGKGDRTIVFLSGGGTPSPILDFKALTSRLTDSYRIVVIEKFGYGFSDDVKEERPIAKILEKEGFIEKVEKKVQELKLKMEEAQEKKT